MFNEEYYLNLIRNQPVDYHGLVLRAPSLREICDIGLQRFDELILPFAITKDCFKDPIDSILCGGILRDIKLLGSFVSYLDLATHFARCAPFPDRVELTFEKNEKFTIDDSNFDDICDIVLKMNGKSKIEVEKRPNTTNDRVLDIWNKLSEGRRRHAEKNRVHLYDMLNVCEFGGEYHISMDELDTWSLWKIASCYKARCGWKSYNDALDIALVSGDSKHITGENHWHKQFMIRE